MFNQLKKNKCDAILRKKICYYSTSMDLCLTFKGWDYGQKGKGLEF